MSVKELTRKVKELEVAGGLEEETPEVEPYSYQVIRRMHENSLLLLEEYDELNGPLEHDPTKQLLGKELERLVAHLEELESYVEKHHPDQKGLGEKDVGDREEAVDADSSPAPGEEEVSEPEAEAAEGPEMESEEELEAETTKALRNKYIKALRYAVKNKTYGKKNFAEISKAESEAKKQANNLGKTPDKIKGLGIEQGHEPGGDDEKKYLQKRWKAVKDLDGEDAQEEKKYLQKRWTALTGTKDFPEAEKLDEEVKRDL